MIKKFIKGFIISVVLLMVVFVIAYGISLVVEYNELLGIVTLMVVGSVIGGGLYAIADL